jgi:hypothetical protein
MSLFKNMFGKKAPEYEGRTSVEWASIALDYTMGKRTFCGDAMISVALYKIGDPAAIPILLETFQWVREAGISWVGEIGEIVKKYPEVEGTVVRHYVDLIQTHANPDVRAKAIQGFFYMEGYGKAAIPVLTKALKDKSKGVRISAQTALKKMGAPFPPGYVEEDYK